MSPKFITAAAVAFTLPITPSFAGRLPEPNKEVKICRSSEASLGSRIRTRTRCRTAAQWHDEEAAAVNVPASLRVTGREKPKDSRSPF